MSLLLETFLNLIRKPVTRVEKDFFLPANHNLESTPLVQAPIAKFARGIPAFIGNNYKDLKLNADKELKEIIGNPGKNSWVSCKECSICAEVCPTNAIRSDEINLQIDYGACLQCGLCVDECPSKNLVNSGFVDVYSDNRSELVVDYNKEKFEPSFHSENSSDSEYLEFKEKIGNKGFNFREVCAGSNTGVEWELGACYNNVFDMESIGVRAVASPKHADVLLIAGSMTDAMIKPSKLAWDTMPSPKLIVAIGTDAVQSASQNTEMYPHTPGYWIAGDPPRPDTIVRAFRTLMGRSHFKFRLAWHSYLQEKNKELSK
ncbi:4Fe-4S binding protein [Leptospira sp. GIMC2001]|uniref:4Fe-4S binding protein n=1 Tax=Leptospira sp. GIMC2001 TaxID=1513297 RepID=UPI00234A0339|nr:4Fe-4S binding protein [Leptospira sp. GIMC2001]WCL48838.1 4Fe-4S binding protein [Leptospira sp. GIMC2001]